MKKGILFCLFIFLSLNLFAQTHRISGRVYDKASKDPLPYATVRVNSGGIGTTTNPEGRFLLELNPGKYTLYISFIGYQTDSISLNVPYGREIISSLEPFPVTLPEVVIGAEDPAYRIIREAIIRKKENRQGLVNSEYTAYYKTIFLSSGEIALVQESFTRGFQKYGEWDKEFVLATHKTENLKARGSYNFKVPATKLSSVDFTGERIEIAGNQIVLPIAEDALDAYKYKLVNIKESPEGKTYTIDVIPDSRIRPLLAGRIYIEGNDYALVGVELNSNEGVRFPYLKQLKTHYVQMMSRYKGYWLPQYIESEFTFEINMQGLLSIDPITFKQIYSYSSYKVNEAIPDSVIKAQKAGMGTLVISAGKKDSAQVAFKDGKDINDTLRAAPKKPYVPRELDKAAIDSLRPLPLTQSEIKAFATLDSTKKVEQFIKPKGALTMLVSTDDKKGDGFFGKSMDYLFSYIDYRNNRAAGNYLGGHYEFERKNRFYYFNGAAGYSFGLKKPFGSAGVGFFLRKNHLDRIEMNVFHNVSRWSDFSQFGELINSASVLFGMEDHFNYMKTTGFNAGVHKYFTDSLLLKLYYSSERQASLSERKLQSLFRNSRNIRINPAVNEGFDRKLTLTFIAGANPFAMQIVPEAGVYMDARLSAKSLNSDFNYRSVRLSAQYKMVSMYKDLFIAPYLLTRIDLGYIDGSYGIQHLLSPDVAMRVVAMPGVFKALKPYSYSGNALAALHLEHNWRTVPFQAVGLNFLTDMSIDFITGLSTLKVWDDSGYNLSPKQDKPYWEAYIGLSRILGLLRLDAAYSSQKRFTVTAGMAVIL